MPKSGYAQISAAETPYVHVVWRTVRRSFFCSKDKYSTPLFPNEYSLYEYQTLVLQKIPAQNCCAAAIAAPKALYSLFLNLT